MNDFIKSVGYIIKQEKLASVEHDTNCRDLLLLESLLPYPGYHGTTIPDRLEPDSLFAVLKNDYTNETIIRAIQKVKDNCDISFDAAPGTIIIENKPTRIIRIKGLVYVKVGDVIRLFENFGMQFKKAKKINPYDGIIKIFKYFHMKMLSDGIYEDIDVKEFFYLRVYRTLDWKMFEKITKDIKYNIEDLIFDAAQLAVFESTGMVDFVRIYDRDQNIDKLSSIREHYLEAFSKL